jgi:hypothetical protein
MIYRYGPSREDAKWRWVTWGSVTAAVLWLGASMLFSWYVANFDSYNKTYGSLGAGVGFMVWIWLSVVIVHLGAELNAEMEHQTATDSTQGAPLPLGSGVPIWRITSARRTPEAGRLLRSTMQPDIYGYIVCTLEPFSLNRNSTLSPGRPTLGIDTSTSQHPYAR